MYACITFKKLDKSKKTQQGALEEVSRIKNFKFQKIFTRFVQGMFLRKLSF